MLVMSGLLFVSSASAQFLRERCNSFEWTPINDLLSPHPADCVERAIDEYLRASEKIIIVGPNRPTLTQLGSLIQYTAPPLRFPWLPHEQSQGRSHVIYST